MTKKRLIASTVMEKQRAIKKTALISAPTTWTQFDQHIVLSLIAVSFPNPPPTGMTFTAVGESHTTRDQKINLATNLTSARAHPNVFCFHSFGLMLTLT